MRAGIVVDNYKLPVFRKRLTEAGYTYTNAGAFTGDTTILHVETDNAIKLHALLKRCQAECRKP